MPDDEKPEKNEKSNSENSNGNGNGKSNGGGGNGESKKKPSVYDPLDRKKMRARTGPAERYWSDLGWEDPVVKHGKWRLFYYQVREHDPYYYDPNITDSVIGPNGEELDRMWGQYQREEPGNVSYEDWRDRRYFLDQNVKSIYEKYPIAKQHPGLMFRLTGTEPELMDKNRLPGNIPTAGWLRQWPGLMPLTWKFFSAPFGEECHVKTAVCAKYGLLGGSFYFVYKAPMFMVGRGWRYLLHKWAHVNSLTVPAAAAWAAASCVVGNIRKEDDGFNLVAGGVAFGSIIGMRKGFYKGWHASIISSILCVVWYYAIAHEHGLTGKFYSGYEHGIFGQDPSTKEPDLSGGFYDKHPWAGFKTF